MNLSARNVRERARNHEARKSGSRAKIKPNAALPPPPAFPPMLAGEGQGGGLDHLQELERVGDMARPKRRNCRRRDEIYSTLPSQKQRDKPVKARDRFT